MKKIFLILSFIHLSTSARTQTIFETLSNSPDHSQLVEKINFLHLVNYGNLYEILSDTGNFTIFAPTNDAFGIVSITESANLSGGIHSLLHNTLAGHIIQDSITSDNFTFNENISSLFNDQELIINLTNNSYSVTNNTETGNIITSDIICSNGVIHVIDRVLILNQVNVDNIYSQDLIIKNINDQIFVSNNSNTLVKIISVGGQTVFSKMFNGDIVIDTNFLQSGLYVISLGSDDEIHVSKFFK